MALKEAIKSIPIVGPIASGLARRLKGDQFDTSSNYWERRYAKGGNSGAAPTLCKVLYVDARPVRGIEKRPKPGRAERRIHAQVFEGVKEIRKALMASLARGDGDP